MSKYHINLLISIILLTLNLSPNLFSQHKYPKREMRAVWIATVGNIDWPSKRGLSPVQQRQEFIEILEMHKKNNMNAVVVQIRPSADAFYPSEYEPWSVWLTGTQGKAPDPYYDPLRFMIEETHNRCMEFHAWLNPYRVFTDTSNIQMAENHIASKHPEWFVDYGHTRYFDPALPQTREFVCKVIGDVTKRYDIDAIHFDDYFYPYKIKGKEFPDSLSFENHNRGFSADKKDDWRRDNVNLVIKMLHDTIKSIKPYVKFGISPFGIWRNKKSDPRGSETNGSQNYDDLYADILLWLEKDWIDYVTPQIYWHIGKEIADYAVLAKWWSKNNYNKQLYIGQAIYRMNQKNKAKAWHGKKEIPRQIELNRSLKNVSGSMYFTTHTFKEDPNNISKYLRKNYYKYPALVPEMPELDSIKPKTPVDFSLFDKKTGYDLVWDMPATSNTLDKARYFVVYRSKNEIDFNKTENIFTITSKPEIFIQKRFFLFRSNAKFYVTAVDRLNNESLPTKSIKIKH
ncbi:MAG: family 10 glycosylhydrolase [Bacteroidota bacterium]